MNAKLETRLSELYPSLFRGQDMPVTENLMSFGCECSDGWFRLINTACSLIAANVEVGPDGKTNFLFTQIKEKYGTLRMYSDGGNEYTDGVISMAEAMSGHTCELCGNQGKLGGIGWLATRCGKCVPDAAPEKEPEAFQEMKIKRLETINEALRNELVLQQQAMTAMRLDQVTDAAWNQRPESK